MTQFKFGYDRILWMPGSGLTSCFGDSGQPGNGFLKIISDNITNALLRAWEWLSIPLDTPE